MPGPAGREARRAASLECSRCVHLSSTDAGHGLREAKNRLCQLHTPVQAAESPLALKKALHVQLTPILTPFKYIRKKNLGELLQALCTVKVTGLQHP